MSGIQERRCLNGQRGISDGVASVLRVERRNASLSGNLGEVVIAGPGVMSIKLPPGNAAWLHSAGAALPGVDSA